MSEEVSKLEQLKSNLAAVVAGLDRMNNKTSRIVFVLPDYDRPSGGMQMTYSTIKHLKDNGYNAVIAFSKSDFVPQWKPPRYPDNVQILGLSEGFNIQIDDILVIPEGMTNIMENLVKGHAPCKTIVFCQNWYYILNSLPPGVGWHMYNIHDCISISRIQSRYINTIMPKVRVKDVNGRVDPAEFTPPTSLAEKLPTVAFIPSRWDNGMKSYNVIKTFFCLYPHLKWVSFKEIKGLSHEDFCDVLKKSAFFIHFDEYSSWGTAPIEAWINKCYVAGWDGFGGREYMKPVTNEGGNTWLAPNGDVIALAVQLGKMVESWIVSDIPEKYWDEAQVAIDMFAPKMEEDSILRVYGEYVAERISELNNIKASLEKEIENENS